MLNFADKPLLMGILNVTPDSFSDGGRFNTVTTALNQVEKMLNDGVDIIDIGGESTRPYSQSVSSGEQIHRVIPVIKAIRQQFSSNIPLSIDTRLCKVAKLALAEGVDIINDISAGYHDPDILQVAAAHNCPIVLMHIQGTPQTMQDNPQYRDIVKEVMAHWQTSVERAKQAGIRSENIILDPGIGFGKTAAHNLRLLNDLHHLTTAGYPIMLGTSRKAFLAAQGGVDNEADLALVTAITTALAVMANVKILRVHDVKANRQALDLAWAIKQASA